MLTLIFSRVGGCPPCPSRAGAHGLTIILLQIYCLVSFERILKIAQHLSILWRRTREEVDCLKHRVRWALSCWKIWRMAGRNCCNSVTLRFVELTNLAVVIDKYRSGVGECQSLVTLWLMPSVTKRYLFAKAFCLSCWLMDGCAYSQLFSVFFGVTTVNMISSVNIMMLSC